MMSAAPLPMPQGAPGAGFAAFLATIGQAAAGGETGGFDQLLADAPPLPSLAVAGDAAAPAPAAMAQDEPAEASEEDGAPTGAAPDAAAVEDLLAALAPAVAAVITPAAKPEAGAAPAAAKPAVGSAPAARPPAASVRADAAPIPDAPLSAPLAAPKPASALPTAAVLLAEPRQAARPLDGGAAMTVLFPQALAEGAAAIVETAQPAPVATRTLDLSNDDVWIEQLARDIVAAKSDGGDISFRLMPRHLGRLDVAMRVEEGGVALKLDTQHETTAKIVTAAQSRLVDDLRQQGVRVAGAEVTCTPGETGRHSQQGQAQQGQGRASATPDTAHLIETAAEAEPREEARPADRRGRFA